MKNYIHMLKKQLNLLQERRRLLDQLYDLKLDSLNPADIKQLSELQDKYIYDRDECDRDISALEDELYRLELASKSENN